jgi:hypothetical protein
MIIARNAPDPVAWSRMRAAWIAVTVVGARVAYAQPAPPDPPEPPPEQLPTDPASKLFQDGRVLLDDNHPAEACAKFQEAIALAPDELGIMLNLGLCQQQQDHIASALVWFRRAQVRASEQGQPDAEDAAKASTTALAAKVPTLALEVATTLGPATVTIDGTAVPETDRSRVEIDAGHHVVEASAGVAHAREELDIADGEARTIRLALAPPVPPKTAPPPRLVTSRTRAYVLLGAGGALLGGSLALGLVGRQHYDNTDHLSTRDAWQDGVRWGGTTMFLLGAGAVGYGAWSYFHPRRHPAKEHMMVAPAASRGTIGLAVGGAF